MLYHYKAKVVRIVDGDTVELQVDLGFYVTYKHAFRLADINAPEIRTKDQEEKKEGMAAKEALEKLLPVGSEVSITTEKTGKYGRWLAHLYVDAGEPKVRVYVNEEMVKLGHAKWMK